MQTWFRDLRMVEPRSVKARKSAIASVATLKPPPSRHSTHHAHDDRVQQFRQFRRPSLRTPQSLDFAHSGNCGRAGGIGERGKGDSSSQGEELDRSTALTSLPQHRRPVSD
jgi:hypothetical protein